MKAIRIFSGEGMYSPEALIELCTPMIKEAKEDKNYLHYWNSPKWFLAEIYGYLKHNKDLPELDEKRKREIWKESKHDKMLAFSLYLVEVI